MKLVQSGSSIPKLQKNQSLKKEIPLLSFAPIFQEKKLSSKGIWADHANNNNDLLFHFVPHNFSKNFFLKCFMVIH